MNRQVRWRKRLELPDTPIKPGDRVVHVSEEWEGELLMLARTRDGQFYAQVQVGGTVYITQEHNLEKVET